MLKAFSQAFKKFIGVFFPPEQWRLPVIVLTGIFSGIGLFVLYISNATSYLSDKPQTCINCHVMTPSYASWVHSSHREQAVCNDCHVPQDNLKDHYFFKAKDGLRHATIFTMRAEPQVIRIKDAGKEVVQKNCTTCHNKTVHMTAQNWIVEKDRAKERYCWDCHRYTPHGALGSLSATPNVRAPLPGKITSLFDKGFISKIKLPSFFKRRNK